MKYIISLSLLLILISCGEKSAAPSEVGTEKPESKKNLPFEQRAREAAMEALHIPAGEKFKMRIYKRFISQTAIEDAIITINRENYMIDKYSKTGRLAKLAEVGFIGEYNHVMYYSGMDDEFRLPVTIVSSANTELEVDFLRITDPKKMDVIVSYRAHDSGWKDYYRITEQYQLQKFFQWELYSRALDAERKVYYHDIDSTLGIFPRDIVIYTSEFDHSPKDAKELPLFDNTTSKKGSFDKRFFYDPAIGKMRWSKATK